MNKYAIFLLSLAFSSIIHAVTDNPLVQNDAYIRGYVQSLFVNGYGLAGDSVLVRNGYVYIETDHISADMTAEQFVEKVEQALSTLHGVKGVIVVDCTLDEGREHKEIGLRDGVMSTNNLFHALIADPKWPRFSLAYLYNFKNRLTKHSFAPNFGATFSIYRTMINNVEWEFGIQGGLFAIMDIGKTPSTLINADYYISGPLSFRIGPWSGMVRIYHQSSHLGDEFMLTPQGKNTQRINLSFEGIDLLTSYNFSTGFRLYEGGGYIVHKDPSNIKPLKLQGGTEYRAENTFWGGRLRPVTGLDIKSEQLANWTPGISFKTGFQIENSVLLSSEILCLLEAYWGKNMHGQFYKEKISYVGISINAFL